MKITDKIALPRFYRNYDLGITKEDVIMKPKQLMRNVCKVQLIDPLTNKVKEEAVASNVITNYYNRIAVHDQFFLPPFSVSTIRVPPDNAWNAVYLIDTDYFTDATPVEDADIKYMPGNVIGYARKDSLYTGSSPMLGTINLAESSKASDLDATLVFDWPTHAANGTFQALCWYPYPANVSDNISYQAIGAYQAYGNQSVYDTPGSGDYGPCYIEDEWMYYTHQGKVYRNRRSDPRVFGRNSTGTYELLADLSAMDTAIEGIRKDGIYWYVFGDQYDKIYKLDSGFNLIDSWDLSTTYKGTSYCNWTLKNSKIFSLKWVSATDLKLYRFALDGTLENTTQLYNSSALSFFWNYGTVSTDTVVLGEDGDNLLVYIRQGTVGVETPYTNSGCMLVVDPSTETVIADMPIYFANDTVMGAGINWNPTLKIVENVFDYTFYHPEPLAHLLLPTPITKTSDYMLKISYNLVVDTTGIP